jgi:hypothetical protein
MKKGISRKKRILLVLLTAAVLVSGCAGIWYWCLGGKNYIAYDFHRNHEPFTLSTATNTDALYSDAQYKSYLDSYSSLVLKDTDKIVADSYIMPGLKSTRSISDDKPGTSSICTSMTPQGVAVCENYILISAYCYRKDHHSVIYVLDKTTHAFVKEIVLDDMSHVGSIAYDTAYHNIWVCCYDENENKPYVKAFSLSEMEAYSFDDGYKPIEYSLSYPIETQKRASFMNYRNHSLYVGFFSEDQDKMTTVQRFTINAKGGLDTVDFAPEEDGVEPIPFPAGITYIEHGVQGFADNGKYLFTIQSSGSQNNSKLKIFKNPNEESDQAVNQALGDDALQTITIPPMAEEIYYADGYIYICFESAGYVFRGRDAPHIDRVMVIKWE